MAGLHVAPAAARYAVAGKFRRYQASLMADPPIRRVHEGELADINLLLVDFFYQIMIRQ